MVLYFIAVTQYDSVTNPSCQTLYEHFTQKAYLFTLFSLQYTEILQGYLTIVPNAFIIRMDITGLPAAG